MTRLRPLLALACLAGLLLAAAQATTAATPKKVPKIKTRIAKVQIDVSGYVETRKLHDTTSDCFAGESWTQINRYTFDSGRFVNVNLKRVTGEGFDPIVTSSFSTAGTANVAGRITGYRTTNNCTGEKGPVRPEPQCSSTTGKTAVSLQEAPLVPVGEDDPTPLRSNPLMIAILRKGGGRDPLECLGAGAQSLTGEAVSTAVVTTSAAPAVSVILPAGISVLKLFGIRRGQKISRAAIVTGPCSRAAVRVVTGAGPSPSPGPLNADGDCQIAGKLRYTIRPRPVKK